MANPIGTLIPAGESFRVAGTCCPKPGVPVYRVNIYPYNQHCVVCGALLVEGEFETELFDGR